MSTEKAPYEVQRGADAGTRQYCGKTFFVHIPKCGGQTLQDIFAKNFRPREVLHVNEQTFVKCGKLLTGRPDFPRLIMGHHSLQSAIFEHLSADWSLVTMLRDPIQRALSYYFYLRAKPQGSLAEIAKKLSLTDFIDHPAGKEIRNGMARRLLGPDIDDKQAQTSAEIALDILREKFFFFGIQESFDASLLILKRHLGLIDVFYTPRNVGALHQRSAVSQQELEHISKHNMIDIKIYNFAVQDFVNSCAKMGMTDDLVERFREDKKIWSSCISSFW